MSARASRGRPSVIWMGSKPGSVVCLDEALRRGWRVEAVVVSPTVGHPWASGPSLADFARERGLPVMVQAELPAGARADFVVSYMYRHRVLPRVLGMATRAAVNFHAGPLPRFGGWAFYNVAILEDAAEYGCTCHHMDDGFDTGPLVRVRTFPIAAESETAVSLERKAQREMVRLFLEFCELAEGGGELPREPQDPRAMRYLSKQEFERLKEIPPGSDAVAADRRARAFWYPPYECAYVTVGGKRLQVVPDLVKQELARGAHAGDYDDLLAVARTARASRPRPSRADDRDAREEP